MEFAIGLLGRHAVGAGQNQIEIAFSRLPVVQAVGRTQEILFILADLVRSGRLGPLKVYVDSPMASRATEITMAFPRLLDDETRSLAAWLKAHPKKMSVEFVSDAERSKQLNDIRHGAVIISASGMCEAGRIKYHLRENLPRSESSILIAGFQAAGTQEDQAGVLAFHVQHDVSHGCIGAA